MAARDAGETKAILVQVDGLTFGQALFNRGDVVLDATAEMLACADERRKNDGGMLLCKRLTKQEALKAAKAADRGSLTVKDAGGTLAVEAVVGKSNTDDGDDEDEDDEEDDSE